MESLKGYIGVLWSGFVPPVPGVGETLKDVFSGLYINQLPGISLKRIESLADDEQTNFLGVWEDVERRALLKFGTAIRGRLNTDYSVVDRKVIDCLVDSNKDLFAVALWYLEGVEMMIENTSTDRLNFYTTIDLEKAEKLKSDYLIEYQATFDDAMAGLNVKNSACIPVDVCVHQSCFLSFVESSV